MGKICTFCKHKRAENRCALISSNASVENTERCCYYEPVEEVLPVVHAHWIFYANGTCDCSNCHTVWESNMLNRWIEYCPFCGAKMDEKEGQR